jgi:hypothetical protein
MTGPLTDLIERIAAAARAGGISEFDLATLRLLVLEHRELSTIELAERVGGILRTLRGMSPGERREAVCARLGISRRRFYELRKLVPSAAAERTVDT